MTTRRAARRREHARPGLREAGIGIALALLTLAAYGPAFRADFIWDDDAYVTGNTTLDDLGGLARIWLEPGATPQYYPLTFTSLWLEHRLYADAAAGYHATNVLLHTANAILVWRLLAAIGLPGAPLAAAIFAVHPVHVESVAWISERKNVLSGACYLGAFLAAAGMAAAATASERRRRGLVTLALFVAALLAKTVTCTLPVALLLVLWWRRDRLQWRDLRAVLPLVAIGLAAAPITIWLERTHVGAHGALWDLSLPQRLLIAGRALWFYAASLAWPHPLSFVYPRWHVDAASAVQWLPPLAAAAAALAAWLGRRRLGKGPVVALAGFAITLAPALGFIDVYPMRYTFVADHYQYLASLFLIAPAAAAAAAGARRRRIGPRAGAAAAALLLAVLAVLTWRRATIFADQETLWRDVIAKNPAASMAHINLAMWLQQRGRGPEALAELAAALRLEPDDAEVHGDIGVVLASLGRSAEARRHLERALALAPASPLAHNNLANALAAAGDLAAAADHYRTAIRLRPRYPEAENNLANVLVHQNRIDEALRHYEAALAIDPDYADAHANLASVLAAVGRGSEAIPHYRRALALRPGTASLHNALGLELARRGEREAAIAELEKALALAPGYDEARSNLAAVRTAPPRTATP
ncbi:MAG: tetratricopeptide repeat protein [Myxococcales bacterium]|jgi:Flp pilus assembly protein TadD|nr:tetratricopeptide repeat protein [Myxococcales bacterium]